MRSWDRNTLGLAVIGAVTVGLLLAALYDPVWTSGILSEVGCASSYFSNRYIPRFSAIYWSATVGVGSVVTGKVAPYAIVFGAPAKVIMWRQ